MLFVIADLDAADLGPFWLVPSRDYERLALRTRNDVLRISASTNPASQDKWKKPYAPTSHKAPT